MKRRRVRAVTYLGAPKPAKPSDEQVASLQLYSTAARKVRAVPTRRPINRKKAA